MKEFEVYDLIIMLNSGLPLFSKRYRDIHVDDSVIQLLCPLYNAFINMDEYLHKNRFFDSKSDVKFTSFNNEEFSFVLKNDEYTVISFVKFFVRNEETFGKFIKIMKSIDERFREKYKRNIKIWKSERSDIFNDFEKECDEIIGDKK